MSTKKFFRFIFAFIGIVILGMLILGAVEPKDVEVVRHTVINAPKEVVFDQMVRFKNWPVWSPWSKLDTSMKNTFTGPDGQAGSIYHWSGNEKITGEVEIKNESVSGSKMNFSFKLIKPSESLTKGYLEARDSAGLTIATFSFTNHFDYPWNAMVIFMDLEKIMGKDLVKGLDNLKTYCEARNTTGPTH